MDYIPPYINSATEKLIAKLELEVTKSEKRIIDARKDLEGAEEYKKLCAEKLERVKKEYEKQKENYGK